VRIICYDQFHGKVVAIFTTLQAGPGVYVNTIGVGVLAGTVVGRIEGMIGSKLDEEGKSDDSSRESVMWP